MFNIHKHSIVQLWNLSTGTVSEILASDIEEGDTLRGYNFDTQEFTKVKVVSKVAIPMRCISLKTSIMSESIMISESTFLASTRGAFHYKQYNNGVKIFKKPYSISHLYTPRPSSYRFDILDVFVSIVTMDSSKDSIIVDNYVQVTEKWNGIQIKRSNSNSFKEGLA